MGALLKLEFRKLARQKSFYVCLIVFLALIFLTGLIFRLTDTVFDALEVEVELSDPEDAEMAEMMEAAGVILPPAIDAVYFLLSSLSGAEILMLLAVFVPLFTCQDNAAGTAKNILGKGYSRVEFYLSKYVAVLAASAVFALAGWIVSFPYGAALLGIENEWNAVCLGTLATQFVGIFAIATMFFAVSVLLRRAGGAIAINIFVPSVISTFFTLGDLIFKPKKFSFSNFWLTNAFQSVSNYGLDAADLGRALVCFGISLAVFLAAAIALCRKQEA